MDKPELLLTVLDRYDVRFSQHRSGWQSVRCPNEFGHAHADQNPSARLNLTLGLIRCMGCDLNGDAYTLVMAVEGIPFREAADQIGSPTTKKEEDWLI
jgi:hypothetical protein